MTGSLAACSTDPPHQGGEAGTPSPRPAQTAPAKAALALSCLADPPASWTSVFAASSVPTHAGESLSPVAVGTRPGQLFAQDWDGGRLRLVELDGPEWRRQPIADLSGAQDQVESAAFDGRWLVWAVTHSYASLDDFDIFAWDSHGGQTRHIGAAARTNGQAAPGPFVILNADHGIAAWTQSAADGSTQLHLVDLAQGGDRVIASGHPGAPVISWPLVVWAEPSASGAPLRVASAITGQIAPVPQGLAGVTSTAFLGGAPGLLVVVSHDYRTVSLWRAGDDTLTPLYNAPEADPPQYPVAGNRLVAWHGGDDLIAVDMATRHAVRLAAHAGWVYGSGDNLVITSPATAQKSEHPAQNVIAVDTRLLGPAPGCSP